MNDWLNERLGRTEFMPFAPAVLESDAANLFVGYDDSPTVRASRFMTVTYDVVDEWHERLQAVVHVDGTARPQVVRHVDNPRYHDIIAAYHRISGIPAIINTSFNMHEEPIVESPSDAIRAFKAGQARSSGARPLPLPLRRHRGLSRVHVANPTGSRSSCSRTTSLLWPGWRAIARCVS